MLYRGFELRTNAGQWEIYFQGQFILSASKSEVFDAIDKMCDGSLTF